MPRNDKIARFDDFEAVRFVQYFGEKILEGCATSLDELQNGLDSQLKNDERVGALLAITPVEATRKLGIAEAAPAARAMLSLWSADRAIAPALKKALTEWRDDDLAADVIVSVGYVVSLWICIASFGFKGKIGSFTIEKRVVPLDEVKKLIEPFATMLGRRKEGARKRSSAAAAKDPS